MPVQNRRLDWVGGGKNSSCSLCSQPNPHPCMLCTCFTCFFFYVHVNREAVSSLYIVFFLLPSLANPTPHFCVLWAHFTCFFFCTCIYREAVNSLFSSNHLHQEDMIGCWSQGRGGQWCQPLWPQWGRHRSVNDREPQSPLDLHYKEFGTVTILWCFRDKIFFK